ncbi:portal protein [Candidatus Tisiphia endosymbiont of Ceraclea dissimilis]|uniref:portal protein n=1 Tax=Candidatus Tisiphia endosymbiont of Ceraclea dissimilis TaxID=3077928 RepID=UPI003CCB1E3A
MISQSGYSYFPFFVTRWVKEEGEVYGYAPAHHVLPDIKLLNSLRQITLKVAQKQLDPPLLVPKDGYYLPLYTTPGSVNFYRNGMADKIIPLTGMENILPTEIEQNQCRDAIYKAFYIDIFRMQKENKEMTATEVQIRTEEQYRLMSPMVGRIESELLNPLIMAIYQTLIKYNRVPILEGTTSQPEIEIEYVSPLSRAQKTSAISSVEQVLGFFQRSGISNFFPEIYDNINWDECFKLFFELRGSPNSILKNEQEVLQIRQQRKMMQMQQLQQQQIQGQ